MVLEAHVLFVRDRAEFFSKKRLPWKRAKKKKGFLNLFENLVINFFWI